MLEIWAPRDMDIYVYMTTLPRGSYQSSSWSGRCRHSHASLIEVNNGQDENCPRAPGVQTPERAVAGQLDAGAVSNVHDTVAALGQLSLPHQAVNRWERTGQGE